MASPSHTLPRNLSTLQRLRQGVQQRFEANLLERVQGALAATAAGGAACAAGGYEVWLFGSRARGDWDGRSDTDLLVVADSQELADGLPSAVPAGTPCLSVSRPTGAASTSRPASC